MIKDNVNVIQKVTVFYDNQLVNNLSIAQICIWNAGKKVINYSDFATGSPLLISIKNGEKILDANILYTKEKLNKLKITVAPDNSSISVTFEFLGKNDGVIIQVFHTGKHDSVFSISGKLKEGPSFINNENFVLRATYKMLKNSIFSVVFKNRILFNKIIGFLSLFMAIILVGTYYFNLNGIHSNDKLFNSIMIWIYVGIMIVYAYAYLKRTVPKGYEIYETNNIFQNQ